MTRRQIAARAHSPEHKRLLLKVHDAWGGKAKAVRELRDWVTADLKRSAMEREAAQ